MTDLMHFHGYEWTLKVASYASKIIMRYFYIDMKQFTMMTYTYNHWVLNNLMHVAFVNIGRVLCT